MQIEIWPIERLAPYAGNPRKNDHAVAEVAKAIKEFGFRVPVIVKSDGTVIDGHLRLKAAKVAGLTEIPTVCADDMTDAQIKAFRISINRMAELADWDLDLLKLELQELQSMDYDVALTGLDNLDELLQTIPTTNGLTDPDDVPDPPSEPITQPGDIWCLGHHRLMCGDSTSGEVLKRLMGGGGLCDMLFTDPPYNVNYQGGTKNKLTIKNDNMASADFYRFLYDCFSAAAEFLSPGSPIYCCHSDSESINFRRALADAGWLVKATIIWVKNTFTLGRMDYHMRHEPILYGWRAGGAHRWYGGRKLSTVVEEMPGLVIKPGEDGSELCFSDGVRTCTIKVPAYEISGSTDGIDTTIWKVDKPVKNPDHPTTKPVEIPRRAIENSSLNGHKVYEPFCGSGSTLIACEMTGRICYAMELDPKYCDVIVKRWEQFTGRKAELT